MLVENMITTSLFSLETVWQIIRIGIIILAGLYFIFSLIVVRQVNLMTETLITEVSPLLRAFAIIHAGLALGIILLLIGFMFG